MILTWIKSFPQANLTFDLSELSVQKRSRNSYTTNNLSGTAKFLGFRFDFHQDVPLLGIKLNEKLIFQFNCHQKSVSSLWNIYPEVAKVDGMTIRHYLPGWILIFIP